MIHHQLYLNVIAYNSALVWPEGARGTLTLGSSTLASVAFAAALVVALTIPHARLWGLVLLAPLGLLRRWLDMRKRGRQADTTAG